MHGIQRALATPRGCSLPPFAPARTWPGVDAANRRFPRDGLCTGRRLPSVRCRTASVAWAVPVADADGLAASVADHAVVDLAQAVESKLRKNAPMHPTVYAVAPFARDKI